MLKQFNTIWLDSISLFFRQTVSRIATNPSFQNIPLFEQSRWYQNSLHLSMIKFMVLCKHEDRTFHQNKGHLCSNSPGGIKIAHIPAIKFMVLCKREDKIRSSDGYIL